MSNTPNAEQTRCGEVLAKRFPELPPNDRAFAQSLVGQLKIKGTLSEKQWLWVEKLADKIEEFGVPTFTLGEPVALVFPKILAMFEKAKAKLKNPSIEIMDGSTAVKMAVNYAGIRINYGYKYVGTIGNDGGVYKPYQFFNADSDLPKKALRFLTKLEADPAGVAAAYGKALGKCCFCKKVLTHPNSVAVGYGPDCAQHYGLPYGAGVTAKAGNPFFAEAV